MKSAKSGSCDDPSGVEDDVPLVVGTEQQRKSDEEKPDAYNLKLVLLITFALGFLAGRIAPTLLPFLFAKTQPYVQQCD